MAKYLIRVAQSDQGETGSSEIDTGYYVFTGAVADTDASVAQTNEFLGLLLKTGRGAVGNSSTSGEKWTPLGSYLSLSTGYEKEHDALVGHSIMTTGRYEVLATGGNSSTKITKAYLADKIASNLAADTAYKGLIDPPAAASGAWSIAIDEFNYSLGQFGVVEMPSVKLPDGWTYTSDLDESQGDAIVFRNFGERIEVREPSPGENFAYDYFSEEKGGSGLNIGIQRDYQTFDTTPITSVWGAETHLTGWPDLTEDPNKPSSELLTVDDSLVGRGLASNVGSLSLEKGHILTASDIANLTNDGIVEVSVATNWIYWPTVPFGTTANWTKNERNEWAAQVEADGGTEEIITNTNFTRGHQFNFVKGATINLGATVGYDLNIGPAFEYTNSYKANKAEEYSSAVANMGWEIKDAETPNRAPMSGGMQFLGVMGASFPTVGNLAGMGLALCTPGFWADATDPDKSNNESNTLTPSSFLSGEYLGPSSELNFDDFVSSNLGNDLLQEKTIGSTYEFHSGNIETIEASADGLVKLKSKWHDNDITESRDYVYSESSETIEQQTSVSSYTTYQEDEIAAFINSTEHNFIRVSGVQAAVVDDWELSGIKVDFDKPDLVVELKMFVAYGELEMGILNLESGVSFQGVDNIEARASELKRDINAIKTDNEAYVTKLKTEIAASQIGTKGLHDMHTKLNAVKASLSEIEADVSATHSAATIADASAITANSYVTGASLHILANNHDSGDVG